MLPKTVLLHRIPFSHTIFTFWPKSTESHHLSLNFSSFKDSQNESYHDFERESQDRGAHYKEETRSHNTPFTHLDPLSVLYPMTHSLTLTLPRVLRYHAEHKAEYGPPAASPTAKTKTKEGQLFHQKKREKKDLRLFLRERN